MSRIRKLSPKQLRVMRWWQRDYDAVICDGAVRSGKTLCLGVSFLLWAMLCFQGQQFALCGKTIGALRRNLLPGVLEEVRGLGFRWEERRALYLHFTMEDNPSLTEKIRRRYQRLYTGIFYRRFILGEWAAAEGRIYDFFDRERDAVPAPEGRMECWRVSVDYGTANPTSMGLWGRRNGIWYRVKEYYYDSRREGRQKTDAEYLRDLRALCGGRRVERVIVDPSAASFLAALRKAGFPVKAADNRVLDGIRVTAGMLREGGIVICRGCTDCLREMELYCWESGKEAPRKENDHAMDELRYFAMDLQREERRFAATFVERRA